MTELMWEHDLRYSQAYRLIGNSIQLHSKVEDIDREGTRKVLIESLYVVVSIAVKKNADTIVSTIEEIAELSKINDNAIPYDLPDFYLPINCQHTW